MSKWLRYKDEGVFIDINLDKITYTFSYIWERRGEAPYLVKIYMEGMGEKDNISVYFNDEETRDKFLKALRREDEEIEEFFVSIKPGKTL